MSLPLSVSVPLAAFADSVTSNPTSDESLLTEPLMCTDCAPRTASVTSERICSGALADSPLSTAAAGDDDEPPLELPQPTAAGSRATTIAIVARVTLMGALSAHALARLTPDRGMPCARIGGWRRSW